MEVIREHCTKRKKWHASRSSLGSVASCSSAQDFLLLSSFTL